MSRRYAMTCTKTISESDMTGLAMDSKHIYIYNIQITICYAKCTIMCLTSCLSRDNRCSIDWLGQIRHWPEIMIDTRLTKQVTRRQIYATIVRFECHEQSSVPLWRESTLQCPTIHWLDSILPWTCNEVERLKSVSNTLLKSSELFDLEVEKWDCIQLRQRVHASFQLETAVA